MAWIGCTRNVISKNFIQYSDNGVNFLSESGGNYVLNNTIVDTRISGVNLDTIDNEIMYNQILSNKGDGIRVFKPDNDISRNHIIESENRGIYVGPDGNQTIIQQNSFINNTQESVFILDAARCVISHNDFLGESERAYASDSGYLNIFDRNYWEGFLSTDENSDGIFDTPYEIDGHAQNRDHYPVTRLNNPLPVESEDPENTETTTTSITATSPTSVTTDNTLIPGNEGIQFLPIVVLVGIFIPIVVFVVYYRRRL